MDRPIAGDHGLEIANFRVVVAQRNIEWIRHPSSRFSKDDVWRARILLKERECADDLQPDFPRIAVGKFSDEHSLVREDPVRALMRKLLKEVHRTHRDERIVVVCEALQVRTLEPWCLFRKTRSPAGCIRRRHCRDIQILTTLCPGGKERMRRLMELGRLKTSESQTTPDSRLRPGPHRRRLRRFR